MKLQHIKLIARHLIYKEFHILYGQEVARRVEHQGAEAEARSIGNLQLANLAVERATLVAHQDLVKRLDAIKQAHPSRGANLDALTCHFKLIPLLAVNSGVELQLKGCLIRIEDFEFHPKMLLQDIHQQLFTLPIEFIKRRPNHCLF